MAAAVGQPLNIPVIVRSLGQDMYRIGMTPDRAFRPGLELIAYLDGNLSSNGLDDPALAIELFYLPWWDEAQMPTNKTPYLTMSSLKSALDHYRIRLTEAQIPFGVPHYISNLANELNKPAYTWHSAVNEDLPNTPIECTRCRLYRAVGLGVMDQLRDVYNMIHACEIANQAERDIAIRRASGFNELYEAAVKKEADTAFKKEAATASGERPDQQSASRTTVNTKGKQRFGPEVEDLKQLTKRLIMHGGIASSKWTWGVDLTDNDLRAMIRGADRHYQLPHSGYDQDLISGPLHSKSSDALDPDNLEDPKDPELRFDELSRSITIIPELHPSEFPTYSEVLPVPEDNSTDPEPDPVFEAFATRAKAEVIKANKVRMQDEVDQPVSFFDYGSEFLPQTALIPHRPWLMPQLPIILPPTNNAIRRANSERNDSVDTDHIHIAESAMIDSESDDQIDIHPDDPPDDHSDDLPDHQSDDLPDHIDIYSDDNFTSHLDLPVSDDDAMDVVQSDESDIPRITDPESDQDIVFPESPFGPTQSAPSSGVMERDPFTGRFTGASFANFPDAFLD